MRDALTIYYYEGEPEQKRTTSGPDEKLTRRSSSAGNAAGNGATGGGGGTRSEFRKWISIGIPAMGSPFRVSSTEGKRGPGSRERGDSEGCPASHVASFSPSHPAPKSTKSIAIRLLCEDHEIATNARNVLRKMLATHASAAHPDAPSSPPAARVSPRRGGVDDNAGGGASAPGPLALLTEDPRMSRQEKRMIQAELRGLPSRIYPNGALLVEAGSTRRCASGIVSGCVVQRGEEMAAAMNNVVVRRKMPGEMYGLARFFSTSNRGACSDVVAEEVSVVREIKASLVEEWREEQPRMAARVCWLISRNLALRVNSQLAQYAILKEDMRNRLA